MSQLQQMELRIKGTGPLRRRLLQQHLHGHDLKVHKASLQAVGGEHRQHHPQPEDQQRKLSRLESLHHPVNRLHRGDLHLPDLRHHLLYQMLANSPIPIPNHNEPMLKACQTQGRLLPQDLQSRQSKTHTNLERVVPNLGFPRLSWAKESKFHLRHQAEEQFLHHPLNEKLRKEIQ